MRLDIAGGRERQETGKVIIAHGSVEFCQATPISLVDESKESCTGARRTESCVAPRHVDASCDFFVSRNEQRGERGLLRRRAENKEKHNNNPPLTNHTKLRLVIISCFFGAITLDWVNERLAAKYYTKTNYYLLRLPKWGSLTLFMGKITPKE